MILRSSNSTTLINAHNIRTTQEPVELNRYSDGLRNGRRGLDSHSKRDFSLLHTHPASYPMSTGGSYPRGKATGS
jgi:hypothetical protein